MNATPKLELNDILLPPPVSAWPLPWQFWAVLLVILALLVTLTICLRPVVRRRRRRRAAMREWKKLTTQPTWVDNPAPALNRLLKNILSANGHPEVAGMNGEDWTNFLRQRLPEEDQGLLENVMRSLYQPEPAFHPDQLKQAVPRWLKVLS